LPPSFRLPMENSLLNVYKDGEISSYQFQLKWPVGTIFSSVNLLERIGLEVDGKKIPKDKIYLILKERKIRNFKKSNLTFDPVELITIGVEGRGELSQGNHEFVLNLDFADSPGPALSINFSLELGRK